MKRLPLGNLRLRLMLLVVLAVIPAIALVLYANLQGRQEAIAQAQEQVMEATRRVSRAEQRTIEQARQLFTTLSHFPPILQQDTAGCAKLFADLMQSYQGYSAFLATRPDGLTFATYPPSEKPVNLGDRPYFKEAIKSGQFVVGHYILGRVTGKPVVSLAFPVKNAKGKLVTMLVSGLKLDWLNDLLSQSRLPNDAHLAVLDNQGRLLAHNPPEPGLIGKPQFAASLGRDFLSQREGTYQGVGTRGQARIFGFTRLGKSPGVIYVVLSIPRQAVFAKADRALAVDLAWTAGVLLVALLVAWFMGTASVVKPVQRLLAITQRVAEGDLEARVGGPYESGEIGGLASSFDAMAEALQTREAESRRAAEALREGEERFRTVANFTYDWEWWRGMDGRFIFVSPSCQRITGYEAQEFLDDKDLLLRIVHPEDKPLVERHLATELKLDADVSEDFRIITKTGETVWIEHLSRIVVSPNGKRLGRRASNRDGTERKRMLEELSRQSAFKSGRAELFDLLRGNQQVEELCRSVITFLCQYLGFEIGLLHLADDGDTYHLAASYAYTGSPGLPTSFKLGEGLVGQAAQDQKDIMLTEVPEDYILIESGLGQAPPRNIHLKPITHNGRVRAVLELGTLKGLGEFQSQFLDSVGEGIAIALDSAEARKALAESLEESQALTEELQAQQEELSTTNEELEEQTLLLKRSEEQLKAQQEELQVTNEELEEKNEMLGRQKNEVESARKGLQEKAEELALASKYKSEFLANMSHELRTPLNSLLLLAQSLADNKGGNLTSEQVEFARIIHNSGSDLLNLINEILDLAKIEAGRISLSIAKVKVEDLAEGVRVSFGHLAKQNGLALEVEVSPDAPAELVSDKKRIEQVIRNLVSNAIKFTEHGKVTVAFGRPSAEADLRDLDLERSHCLAIAVRDTGIGIDPAHQKVIFEAFQQVDGSTSRKYGGTGLGLSISRELAHLLGGKIHLSSTPGQGSTFTMYLPISLPKGAEAAPSVETGSTPVRARQERPSTMGRLESALPASVIDDDRENLAGGDKVILIVEDDPAFARILYKKCQEKGFKCLAASNGETGLDLAGRHLPSAVILDLGLPGMTGWAVLAALKDDTRTRHIPVHIISVEQASSEALRKGAVGHATKPINQQELENAFKKLEEVATKGTKRVLVVEDDAELRRSTVKLIGGKDVTVDEVATGQQAMEALRRDHYDCMVLDLGLPDIDGRELLHKLIKEGVALPPVIVHTAREITPEEEADLRESAESIVIKDVRSQERLLDEVSLFLHRMVSKMPAKERQIIRNLHESDVLLKGKKVLVVDDDMRTTFALSALLAELGMKPLKADNGQRALRILEEQPGVDLVLMDIMMPVMDGYETMKRIRGQAKFAHLPIIALTAKAMPADREKCLAAGASDYLTKPVDKTKLVSMIRVWLYR